jgi:hypothetical protein
VGGRRYQIAAVLLTYMAVSLAAIPVFVDQAMKLKKDHKQAVVSSAPAQNQNGSASSAEPSMTVTDNPATPDANHPAQEQSPKSKPAVSPGKAFGILLLIGLASPFLELASPLSGLIGLFILFLGMQIAWKMTRRPKLVVDGPF